MSGPQEHPSSIKGSPAPIARGLQPPPAVLKAGRARASTGLAPTPAWITGKRGADSRHIFRDTWQERGVPSPGRGNCSPGSASAITGEGAGACVQTPPPGAYRGLDRKLRLSRGASG